MEMAVRSMETVEMAPGALSHFGRVPEQRLLFPKICLWWLRRCGTVLGKTPTPLGFSVLRLYIGEGALSGGCQDTLTRRGRGQGPGRAALLCGALVAPLRLLFSSLEASVNFWTFDFCFVQFREYFLCSFSETQKQQKTENWHCGDLLIG
jgi:hypothetical protein